MTVTAKMPEKYNFFEKKRLSHTWESLLRFRSVFDQIPEGRESFTPPATEFSVAINTMY